MTTNVRGSALRESHTTFIHLNIKALGIILQINSYLSLSK